LNLIGYFHGIDPAACLVRDGEVIAYVEEERLIRFKHADGIFPIRSIDACLTLGGIALDEVDAFVYGWDAPRYTDGGMAAFYERINERYPPDAGTRAWQRRNLSWFGEASLNGRLRDELTSFFGEGPAREAKLLFRPHHESHAASAFLLSPYERALVLILDGSGDSDCTTLWRGEGSRLEPLYRIEIPHSLGWFYAALTEYLGFKAYDGEYKVMGLAAYGRENPELREKLARVLAPGERDFDYVVDPSYIHHGEHTFSGRYTDRLVELIGLPPRLGERPIEPIHEDLAFETQRALEEAVLRLARHFRDETGLEHLCIGGGVGLNVKMNSRLHASDLFEGVFAFPIPNDSGLGIGAALSIWMEEGGERPAPIRHVNLGPSYDDDQIETQIRSCGLPYRRCDDVADATAELLADGKVVAWFQGRLEGGPRALGGRSILADPRDVASRDRVNAAIKFREYWRPFCPSLAEEAAPELMRDGAEAPYMILAFRATEAAREKVPAVVHVDDTMRVQTVDAQSQPLYHRLLERFAARSGVPVLLCCSTPRSTSRARRSCARRATPSAPSGAPASTPWPSAPS
jgi:carbamoyltransferase